MEYRVRRARADDVAALHSLMTELAVFERYIDRFAITPEIVLQAGFRKEPPDFQAIVVEHLDSGELAGMAVTYLVRYTYLARPVLVVKELYVRESHRNGGIGTSLMRAVARMAARSDCASIRWQVAPWNHDARRFYERLGAVEDREWIDYSLDERAYTRLLHGDADFDLETE